MEQHSADVQELARSDNPDLSSEASVPVGMLQTALSKYIRENYTQEALDDAEDTALEWNQWRAVVDSRSYKKAETSTLKQVIRPAHDHALAGSSIRPRDRKEAKGALQQSFAGEDTRG